MSLGELRLLAEIRQADADGGGLPHEDLGSEELEIVDTLARRGLVEARGSEDEEVYYRVTAEGVQALRDAPLPPG